jgi:hypothetical protein
MADTKLADLTALTTPSGDDILYIVDDPAGTPLDRKIALDNLFTRGTITADAPVLNMSQTWNNGAVTFTGLKFNAATGSNAGSASGSLLMDLLLEGTSKVAFGKNGSLSLNGGPLNTGELNTPTSGGLRFGSAIHGVFPNGSNETHLICAGTTAAFFRNSATFAVFNNSMGLSNASATADVILSRRAAANLRFGAADAAAPVAQTLSVQSVVTGTSNTAGANLTITGSQGTGNAAGGRLELQFAPAGSSGTAQNALLRSFSFRGLSTVASYLYGPGDGTSLLLGNDVALENQNTGRPIDLKAAPVCIVNSEPYLAWSTSSGNTNPDTRLYRDAANTLAQRNGANAQAFRVYNTTDGTNSEFGGIRWAANVFTIGPQTAGTGTARATSFVDGTGTERIGINASNGVVNVASMQLITSSSISYIGADTAGFTLRYASGSNTDMMVRFAGTTSSFPALKRSSTTLQARLADDSAFTNIQGKLTTDTAYTATVIVPTGYLTLYDSTGTAYRVPCVV